jgi:hypothetical protein
LPGFLEKPASLPWFCTCISAFGRFVCTAPVPRSLPAPLGCESVPCACVLMRLCQARPPVGARVLPHATPPHARGGGVLGTVWRCLKLHPLCVYPCVCLCVRRVQGNVTYAWQVDLLPPSLFLAVRPSRVSQDRTPRFELDCSKRQCTYRYNLVCADFPPS